MTEELLQKIREEAEKEIINLEDFNAYARLRSELEKENRIKESLGLLYNINMGLGLAEKTESDVIMSTYKKYLDQIEEKDTNGIYVYTGTYMVTELSHEQIENGEPLEIEVAINDPRATHRCYWDLEGVWSESVDIENCAEFERTHTVIYDDNFYDIQKEFIIASVKEGQEKASKRILGKYKTKKLVCK